MARIRAYFKLDLYFFEHPKVIDLSHPAMVLYIASIAYCNRRETDGFIARPVLRRLIELDDQSDDPTHQDLAVELVRAGLWIEEPPRPQNVQPDVPPRPPDGPRGWRIHDFLEHNDSAADRQKHRDDDAARKRAKRSSDKQEGGNSAGQKDAAPRPQNVQPDTNDRPNGQDAASGNVRGIAVTEQSTSSSTTSLTPSVGTDLAEVTGVAAPAVDNPVNSKRREGKGRAPRTPRHPSDDFVIQRARQIQAESGPDAARAYIRKVGETYGQASREDQLRRLEALMAQEAAEAGDGP